MRGRECARCDCSCMLECSVLRAAERSAKAAEAQAAAPKDQAAAAIASLEALKRTHQRREEDDKLKSRAGLNFLKQQARELKNNIGQGNSIRLDIHDAQGLWSEAERIIKTARTELIAELDGQTAAWIR